MKPLRIFIFGFSVFIILTLISVLSPNENPKILGITIKIPALSSLLKISSAPQYKDISHIIKLSSLLSDSMELKKTKDTIASKGNSSNHVVVNDSLSKSIAIIDSTKTIFRLIDYPAGKDTLLFPFFDELLSLKESKKLIRILHYGDSQIEGDRITSYLRNQLQSKFGGCGIGMLPIVAVNPSSISYVYNISDNWKKYSPFHASEEGNGYRKYGVLINFARITPSSSIFGKSKELEGWIELKRSNIAYALAQQFQQCRIFYGFNKSPMIVEVKQNKTVLDAEIVPVTTGLKELRWNFSSPKDLTISIKSSQPPDVYGIALDGLQGLAVDNIPLRGSSGLEFTKIDLSFLKNFYQMINVKLLILQFGVNIVPIVNQNSEFYEKRFQKQLISLKQIMPDLQIIVIGVSDISRNGTNGYESYPNIEKIRDAQKNAAFNAGCAFWDMFEVMGGRNSMPSWVFANPPLAQKDFVHFSHLGAKIIGEMFYRSFMHEYDRYLEKRKATVSLSQAM
jgi:hypothetical protein